MFCFEPAEVWDKIKYVNDNPGKQGLPRQSWSFVVPYAPAAPALRASANRHR